MIAALKYRIASKTAYGVHSPFVYGFIQDVMSKAKMKRKKFAGIKGNQSNRSTVNTVELNNLLQKDNLSKVKEVSLKYTFLFEEILEYYGLERVSMNAPQGQAKEIYFHFTNDQSVEDILNSTNNDTWVVMPRGLDVTWEQLVTHEEFHLTMDLFDWKIAIKRPGQVKEHFILRY